MEHGLLTDLGHVARENVLHTYLDLALGLPETRVREDQGYLRVKGMWPLSFCHYAADFRSDRPAAEVAAELKLESQTKDGLWVFVLQGDEPYGLSGALLEQGFHMRQCLSQMATRGCGEFDIELCEATDADERLKIGSFMAEQFFPFSPGEARHLVARSTAASLARLFYVGPLSAPHAAMMLSRSEGAVGLYNLCVEFSRRSAGIGGSMVRAAQAMAYKAGVPVTLQCHASLRKWYEALGYSQVGNLNAFFSNGTGRTDII